MQGCSGIKYINKCFFSCKGRAKVNSPTLELSEVKRVEGSRKQTSSGFPKD